VLRSVAALPLEEIEGPEPRGFARRMGNGFVDAAITARPRRDGHRRRVRGCCRLARRPARGALPVGQSVKAAACVQVSHETANILVFHNVELRPSKRIVAFCFASLSLATDHKGMAV
jgi:hypothetical protein